MEENNSEKREQMQPQQIQQPKPQTWQGQQPPQTWQGQPQNPSYPPYGGQPQYGQVRQNAPNGGQPQYGNPQQGQPQYGQFGQNPYPPRPQSSNPQFKGQPQYGNPQQGQPQYGQFRQNPYPPRPQNSNPQFQGQPQYGQFGQNPYPPRPQNGNPQYQGQPQYGNPQPQIRQGQPQAWQGQPDSVPSKPAPTEERQSVESKEPQPQQPEENKENEAPKEVETATANNAAELPAEKKKGGIGLSIAGFIIGIVSLIGYFSVYSLAYALNEAYLKVRSSYSFDREAYLLAIETLRLSMLIAAGIALISFILSLAGLIKSIKKRKKAGIILAAIGLFTAIVVLIIGVGASGVIK